MKTALLAALAGFLLAAAGCAHAHDTGRYHRHHEYAAHHHHRQVVRVAPPPRVAYMPRAPQYYSHEPVTRYSYYPERYYRGYHGIALQVVVPLLYNGDGYIYLR